MNQSTPRKPVKTLSIRIPEELYLEAGQWGIDRGFPSLNAAIIELITTGLQTRKENDELIGQFIIEIIPKDRLKELIDGKG